MSTRTSRATVSLLGLASLVALAAPASAIPHRRHHRHPGTRHPTTGHPAGGATTDSDADGNDEGDATSSSSSAATSTTTTTTTLPPPPPSGGAGSGPAEGAGPAPAGTAPARPVAIDVSVGVRGFHRDLSFTSDLFGVFRPYTLDVAPAVDAALAFYPAALFNSGPLAHIGLVGSGHVAFGISSREVDNPSQSYATQAFGVRAGLRVRIPVVAQEFGVTAGWGTEQFAVPGSSTANDPGLPATRYQFIHAGLDTRLSIVSRFGITASFEYLFVLGLGDLQQLYFPRASAGGIEASLGVYVVLGAGFEVRAFATLLRFFYDMHTNPGDAYVAGGALDQYLSGTLAIAWRH